MSGPGDFMREAIRLSREGMQGSHGGPFGCVIVKDGAIIARGNNRVTSTCDPTAHGEVVAIREACAALQTFDLTGCTLYTSCEPCPMCLAAIYWARIDLIYYANTREDAANIGFDDDFIYREVAQAIEHRSKTMKPLLRDEALTVFQEWMKKEDRIPY
ncbi:MAG TPA: nucleoside deaminase [Steroidobacteraceae bacterium]